MRMSHIRMPGLLKGGSLASEDDSGSDTLILVPSPTVSPTSTLLSWSSSDPTAPTPFPPHPRPTIWWTLAHWELRIALSPPCPTFHSSVFFHVFIISAAFGFGMVFMALRLQRAFTPRVRSRLGRHLHCIGTEFLNYLFIMPGMATLGLQLAAQWLRVNDRRLGNA